MSEAHRLISYLIKESHPQTPWQVGACRLHEHLQMQRLSLANQTAHSAWNRGVERAIKLLPPTQNLSGFL